MLADRTLIDSNRDPSVEGELLWSRPDSEACFRLRFRRDCPLCALCRSGWDELATPVDDGRDAAPALSDSSSSIMGSRGLTSSVPIFPDESLSCDGGRALRDLAAARAPAFDEGAVGDG